MDPWEWPKRQEQAPVTPGACRCPRERSQWPWGPDAASSIESGRGSCGQQFFFACKSRRRIFAFFLRLQLTARYIHSPFFNGKTLSFICSFSTQSPAHFPILSLPLLVTTGDPPNRPSFWKQRIADVTRVLPNPHPTDPSTRSPRPKAHQTRARAGTRPRTSPPVRQTSKRNGHLA